MLSSLSAHIGPETIVCQGMLLTKRIKEQFSGVQELDGEIQGREGKELLVKVFAGEEKKPIWFLRTALHMWLHTSTTSTTKEIMFIALNFGLRCLYGIEISGNKFGFV